MPRLSVEDASAAGAALRYALSTLPLDAPQRADWERVLSRLELRLDVATSQRARRRTRGINVLTNKGHANQVGVTLTGF